MNSARMTTTNSQAVPTGGGTTQGLGAGFSRTAEAGAGIDIIIITLTGLEILRIRWHTEERAQHTTV